MMRRFWLAIYGLVVGAGYAAILQFATPGESALLPVRGLNVVLFMVAYGWCCGKDPLLPARRTLVEIPLIPFALLAALLAVFVGLVSLVMIWLGSRFRKMTAR